MKYFLILCFLLSFSAFAGVYDYDREPGLDSSKKLYDYDREPGLDSSYKLKPRQDSSKKRYDGDGFLKPRKR